MSVAMRRHVERVIARRFVLDVLHAGYSITVCCDGEYPDIIDSTDLKQIMEDMFAYDDVRLYVQKKKVGGFRPRPTEAQGKAWTDKRKWIGWAYFVYGNDGYDVISDYTTNLEPLMKGATAVAKKYE